MRPHTIAVLSLLCFPVYQLGARIDPAVEPHMIDEALTRKLAQAELEQARVHVQAQIDAALAGIKAAESELLESKIRYERAKRLWCLAQEERDLAANTVSRLEWDLMAARVRYCELTARLAGGK